MGVKRIVDTDFWLDEKVIDTYSVEDKYFLLYLITNPRTTQLGIYRLPKKLISFETGYTKEVVEVLLQRFETEYANIKYNQNLQEIAVLNSLKYSIVKGGKPVSDLLTKELSKVKDKELIKAVYERMRPWWARSTRSFDLTVKELFEIEIKKRNLLINDNANDNENDNDNDNEESYPDSYIESYHESYHDSSKDDRSSRSSEKSIALIANKFQQEGFGTITYTIKEMIVNLTDNYSTKWILEAMKIAVKNNKRKLSYVEGILQNWNRNGGMKLRGEKNQKHSGYDGGTLDQYDNPGLRIEVD